MDFDRGAYKDTVLKVARQAGNVPPPDLITRYAITASELRVEAAFTARVNEVSGYWRTLNAGNNQLYKKLVQALLAAHADLEQRGQLTPESFRKQREAAATAARAQLAQRAKSIADSLPCIPVATLARLAEEVAGVIEESEVRDVVVKAGVTVIDPPWTIPDRPPLPPARYLEGHLKVLGLRLSIEAVLGDGGMREGFAVKRGFHTKDNKTIGESTLKQARDELSSRPLDERKTARDAVITLLGLTIADPGKLSELVIWELAAMLRPDIAAGVPVRAVADKAAELGLDPAEALELAVTLSAGGAATAAAAPPENDTEQVEELLRAGDLRAAAELAAALPPEAVAATTRDRVAAAVKEVERLRAEADNAHAAGDTEEEARLLVDLLARQSDGDVQDRLARIAPPPPTQVTAVADGDRIAIQWTHSAARTGKVSYRIVRTATPAAASANAQGVVADTDADSAADPAPPAGVPNHYTVFASRGGTAWSAGAAAPPVTILPEVQALELDATADSVVGSWRLPSAAVDVEVVRTGPGDGSETAVPVRGSLDGFVDATVATGVRYDYRVRAVYRGVSGERVTTTGVATSIRPQGPPVGVTDLTAEPVADGVNGEAQSLALRWTEPASGTVEIRVAAAPPQWPPGTSVPLATAGSYGRPQSGPVTPEADGKRMLRVPVRGGTTFLTVFTTGPRTAVVGNTVRMALTTPVTDLRAVRRGTRVRLSWIWPPGASTVRVTWTGDDANESVDLSLREYTDEGGFTVDAGTGAVDVAVMTLTRDAGGPVLSAPVTRTVPERSPQVRWRIIRRGLRRQVVLALTSDRPCDLPDLVVVRGRGGPPDDPTRGETVARIPRSRLSPEQPLTHPLGPESRTGPIRALRCFIPDGGDGLIFGQDTT